jgi:DNA-binding MarR family transcriptional regulator
MLSKDCLYLQVGRVARKMAKITRKKLASYGLATTQFFLPTTLYEEDSVPISVLAQKVALDKATLTGLLDRWERDDLIKRKADPDDRRAIRIFLTPKAKSMRVELTEFYHQNNGMFLSILTSEEREVFERVVDKLENADFGKDRTPTSE